MLLKLGSKGDDVKKLQEKLKLNPDGDFGSLTEQAVKKWQTENGLTSDGIVGDKTWEKLFGLITETKIPESNLGLDKLKGIVPNKYLLEIPETAKKFNITTKLRLAHFLAQCALESGGFKWVVEFASGSAYEGRKDLGNVHPGDGVKFKGRGLIQCTGRANYTKFSEFCGEDCVANPDLVATKYPLMSAAFFFNSNKLWSICDEGSTDEVVKKVTKRVNGGYNGLAERQKWFDKFWSILK
jgi:putative chitinase